MTRTRPLMFPRAYFGPTVDTSGRVLTRRWWHRNARRTIDVTETVAVTGGKTATTSITLVG
ncbi:MAG: hypothetical protein ABSE77_10615 [Acidimicrobiales bacterium]